MQFLYLRVIKMTQQYQWHEDVGLPKTLLVDVDADQFGEVKTYDFVKKATNHFTEFYGGNIEQRNTKNMFRIKVQDKVIQQIQFILANKEDELDLIGLWLQKEILFPQIVAAHMRPAKKIDLVELYIHITKRGK